jgi:hypothetical protein
MQQRLTPLLHFSCTAEVPHAGYGTALPFLLTGSRTAKTCFHISS